MNVKINFIFYQKMRKIKGNYDFVLHLMIGCFLGQK